MKKVIFLTVILLSSLSMKSFSEESEKDKAFKNDDPAYVNF